METKEKILNEIAKNICNYWKLELPYIKYYGWQTAFYLDDEFITIDDDLIKYGNMQTLTYALIHEISHYVIYQYYKKGYIESNILKYPHNKAFCYMLYSNIEISGFHLKSYLKNAIEYPIVKKLLKQIDLEIKKTKKTWRKKDEK